MVPIKIRCKSFIHRISYHSKATALLARQQKCARILMFHGIEANSEQDFAEQIKWVTKNFKIVPLEIMVRALETNKLSAINNHIAITFDDGLRNNFLVAYPILRHLNTPATFFVCPGLVGSDKWLWNHEIRCRLQSMPSHAISNLCSKLHSPLNSIHEIVEWMKTVQKDQRHHIEKIIKDATPKFRPTADQHGKFDIINWEELAAIDPKLITIGSHTMTHPILTSLTKDEINFELQSSRQLLEDRLQRTVDIFCYPNGSYNEHICNIVKKNYHAAVTSDSGVLNSEKSLDLHNLPRISSADNKFLTAWRLFRPNS